MHLTKNLSKCNNSGFPTNSRIQLPLFTHHTWMSFHEFTQKKWVFTISRNQKRRFTQSRNPMVGPLIWLRYKVWLQCQMNETHFLNDDVLCRRLPVLCTHSQTHPHLHTHSKQSNTLTHTHTQTHPHSDKHTHSQTNTHTHTHTPTHTRTHTHTHTHGRKQKTERDTARYIIYDT